MTPEQMNQQTMEYYEAAHHQDIPGGVEPFVPASQSPQPKRLHVARVEELFLINPALGRELEYVGRELVLKRDCLQISLNIYHELNICLQDLVTRLSQPTGKFAWNDWVMDLTAQLHQMRIQIALDEDEVREMEDKYRKAFCVRL
ncbi:hypothetical protein N7493_004549 [Penicillium malachiteum]|uniref:Uncharacterized protein n=1 Tax=Penicillium malachiteum TaxID=1324776 RepID=A0AAD6MX36_9EURO|nr:hypothetical protein N7493_004549 [Penicillium malachiteum]